MKKFMYLFLVSLIMVQAVSVKEAHATEVNPVSSPVEILDDVNYIKPKSDVIIIRYRDYNGVMQYRRWNETKNKWIDLM